jgi:DNA-binding CsgD family transcriptional regulator
MANANAETPKSDSTPSASPIGGPKDVWATVASEPGTSLGIYGVNGEILWLNQESVSSFYGGRNVRPTQIIGKNLSNTHGQAVAAEWTSFYQRVVERQKPVLVRTIMNGIQYLTWLHPIGKDTPDPERSAEEILESGVGGDVPLPERVISVTRAVGGEPKPEDWATSRSFDFVETNIVDLGPLDALTPRELEVLSLLGSGLSAKEAARVLHRSVKTIINHRTAIGQKLQLDDRVKLAEIANRAGLRMADAEKQRIDRGST